MTGRGNREQARSEKSNRDLIRQRGTMMKGISEELVGRLAFSLVAWFAFSPVVAAQYPNTQTQAQGQQQAQQPPKPAAPAQPGQTAAPPAEAPKVDPAEEAAYKAFYDLKPDSQNVDRQVQLGEDFVQKYPASRYRALIYSRLTQAYLTKQEMDKMYAAGGKALELNPDDYTVLVTLGWVIPHAFNPNELDAQQKLDKAEQYSKHALELLPAITKPEGLTDEEFNKLKNQALSQGHSGLGLVYFRKGRFADSIPELQQATKLAPQPDPIDFFVTAIDYQQLKQYADAATAFDECGKIPGGYQQRCKQGADEAKKLASNQPPPPKK